jgi:hypothetical protein
MKKMSPNMIKRLRAKDLTAKIKIDVKEYLIFNRQVDSVARIEYITALVQLQCS